MRRLPAEPARCEDELLAVAGRDRHRQLPRGVPRGGSAVPTTCRSSRARSPPPTTPSGSSEVRDESKFLVTIGACATAGGIQALRNWKDVDEFTSIVYAHPEYIDTLATSTPIADHVAVDFELRGCPINKIPAARGGRGVPPGPPAQHPRRTASASSASSAATACVMVRTARRVSGPVTQAGCGAICPAYNRGCYGCFGPMETPNTAALGSVVEGARRQPTGTWSMRSASFNAYAEPFRSAKRSPRSAISVRGATP